MSYTYSSIVAHRCSRLATSMSVLKSSGLLLLLLLFFPIGSSCRADVFQTILQNIHDVQLSTCNVANDESRTASYVALLDSDGSFSDIDYSVTSQTNWTPGNHVGRLEPMARCYINPKSKYYQSDSLYNSIVAALNYWYARNPTSTNWWFLEISYPQSMGIVLSLMRFGQKQVPDSTETNILNRLKSTSKGPNQSGSQGTGANKIDIALQWIYRTTLQADKTNLDFAVAQLYLPLTFNLGEGLQADYSYLQHDMQLYTGGYGGSVLSAITSASFYLAGTEYSSNTSSMDLISNFVRLTYLPAVRGQYMLHNSVGRGIALKGGTLRTSFQTILSRMILLDSLHTPDYNDAMLRINGTKDATYHVTPYHRHYWRGDYTLHVRPGYTMDVRMASTRTCRTENGNGENLKGYFLADGGTEIVQRGDEYTDIYPVWDWSRIPGTTTPALASVPQPSQWGKYGMTNFAGGVSDSLCGVTAYYYKDYPGLASYNYNINTEARKSWFFFDKEIVCLGTGIKSTNDTEINTTVNQCLLKGTVSVMTADGKTATLDKGDHAYTNLSWLNHDSISYYFPKSGIINVRNDAQTGVWNSISSDAGDGTTWSKDVLKVWFNHGVKPADSTYAYVIVPCTGSIAAAQSSLSDIEMVNNDTVQAVYNKTLQKLGVVFYQQGGLHIGGMTIESRQACTAMFSDVTSSSITARVSDPTHQLDSLTFFVNFPALAKSKLLGCKLDKSAHYAGSTQLFTVDSTTTDFIYVPVRSITLDSTSVSLTESHLYGQLNAKVLPDNATYPAYSWSSSDESIVRVDAGGHLMALAPGEAVITVTSVEGKSVSCPVRVSGRFFSSVPTADAYVYDGSKTANYGNDLAVVVRTDGSGYTRQGYFMFPLDGLDHANLTTQDVKVLLQLYVEYAGDKVTTVSWRVFPVTAITWDESTITWNNKPAVSSTVLATLKCFNPISASYDMGNIATFDITSYALTQYKAGIKALSLFVDQSARATSGKGISGFASKETRDVRKLPKLFMQMTTKTGISTAEQETEEQPFVMASTLYFGAHDGTNVQLYTADGKLLASEKVAGNGRHSLDVGTYPKGIYILRVGKVSSKVVKP